MLTSTLFKIFCQASLYNDLRLQGRFNYRWSPQLITKAQAELPPSSSEPGMLQLEADYQASDFTANVKAINPSILEGGVTGIVTGDYLQSVTPQLALGVSALWQRAAMTAGPDTLLSYAARYRSKGGDWVASTRILGQGSVQVSYWKRIAEKLEGGVDINLQFAPAGPPGLMGPGAGGIKKEGLATLGAKYDFRASTVRVQGDSQGKLGVLLEKRVAPAVQLTFAGELDHAKVRFSNFERARVQC
jgi:mitochondrial import receptor subunit TOM40